MTHHSHSPTANSTIARFPMERVAGDLDDIAAAVHGYCVDQHVALSVDHYLALEAVVASIGDLNDALRGLAGTLR